MSASLSSPLPTAPRALPPVAGVLGALDEHVERLAQALPALRSASATLARWASTSAPGCSTARGCSWPATVAARPEAQHLTAELAGRFDGERRPLSAIALHADTSSLTAIGNDYGYGEVYARQVRAHARAGDVVLLFSTSGRSANLVAAVAAVAAAAGAVSWALTGPRPNPLAQACDDAVCLPGDTATVQETHLAALHVLCRAVEATVFAAEQCPARRRRGRR